MKEKTKEEILAQLEILNWVLDLDLPTNITFQIIQKQVEVNSKYESSKPILVLQDEAFKAGKEGLYGYGTYKELKDYLKTI